MGNSKRTSKQQRIVALRSYPTCRICDREYAVLQQIGRTWKRCQDCVPGSYNWFEYWLRIPAKERGPMINEALTLFRRA